MIAGIEARIAAAIGGAVEKIVPLSGGSVGRVYRARLAGGRDVVVKASGADAHLDIEGAMLNALAELSRLPVPRVLHAEPDLLIMTHIANDGGATTAGAERHAAELIAALHDVAGPGFGFDFDTLIGGLHQPNPWCEAWVPFFRDRRLLAVAREAHGAGTIGDGLLARIERFADDLGRWLAEPARPALLHGDLWGGNVLIAKGRIAGFVDPACYYGHPEMELAFATLFSTFGEAFFARYRELRPLAPGFFEERRDIYNLYPLLVHARLFGGSYGASAARVLKRLGY